MWFWLVIVLMLLAIEYSVVGEKHYGVGWLAVGLFGLWWYEVFDVVLWVYHHPIDLLLYSGGYLVCGLIWCFIKWYLYLKNVLDALNKVSLYDGKTPVETYRKSYDNTTYSDGVKRSFTQYLQGAGAIPQASNNKYLISIWLVWWPFSIFWTLFADIIRRGLNWIITHYISVFDKITNMVFGSLNK